MSAASHTVLPSPIVVCTSTSTPASIARLMPSMSVGCASTRQAAPVRLVRRRERDVRLHEGEAAAALRRHQEQLGRVRAAVEVRLQVRERLLDARRLRQHREKVGRHVAQVDRDAVLRVEREARREDARADDLAALDALAQHHGVGEVRGRVDDGREADSGSACPSSAALSSAAGRAAASANFASVKCTWLFWNPAVTVPPSQAARRRAPPAAMSFAGPAAAIFPSTIRIAASSMGAASGDT